MSSTRWALRVGLGTLGFWLLTCLAPTEGGILAQAAATPEAPAPKVELATGALEGVRIREDEHAVAYLGVAYAAPPIGERRWRAPQEVLPWTGTRKATSFGAACPQLPARWLPTVAWSEDCLYLNIWSDRPGVNAPQQPVIVYFHGGSNTAGYSQLNPLGPAMSKLGIIFVSANYRLGPFGFLAHPGLTAESDHHASGNYGLMDQIQALKWVQGNIARFGGDPGRITVMGQSAGAVDICLLMTSRQAEGLFQRAILESGDCQGVLNEDRVAALHCNHIAGAAEASGERLAQDLHVENDSATVRQLRAISAANILKTWSEDPTIHFSAIVDGWIVPEQPAKMFAEGREMAVPILVGSNADEATVFSHGGPTSIDEYMSYLRADTGSYAEREFAAYSVNTDAQVPARYLQLQNESFAYGAWSMARALSRIGKPSYLYRFSYSETGKRAALGAYHGEELYFLSDSFPNDWQPTGEESSFGRTLRSYWTQFAKTGDPNTRAAPRWPPYKAQTDLYLDLGPAIHLKPVEARMLTLGAIMKQVTVSR
jgi:para-nitrobenzyl esterase